MRLECGPGCPSRAVVELSHGLSCRPGEATSVFVESVPVAYWPGSEVSFNLEIAASSSSCDERGAISFGRRALGGTGW